MKLTGLNSWKSWGVVVGVSFVNCLVLLPLRISGLLYVEWIPRYNTNRQTAVQPIIISYLLRCVCGPLIGFLLEIIELRTVYTVGSILAATGIGVCFFAENTTFLIVFFGVVYGLGFAAVNSFMPHIVKQHFDKHVTKANGVTFSGSCVSALFISPLAELWLRTFGVTETFLIMSGLMLQAVPVAMLLKDPKYHQRTTPPIADLENRCSTSKECNPSTSKQADPDKNTSPNRTTQHSAQTEIHPSHIKDSSRDLNPVKDMDKVPNKTNNHGDFDVKIDTAKVKTEEGYMYELVTDRELEEITNQKNKDSYGNKDNKYTAAFHSLRVLVHPSYLFIMFAFSFVAFVVTVIPAVIIDVAIDKGIPESEGVYFLMFMPLAELFGSLTLGWVVDRGYLSASNMTAVSFTCLVLACCSLAWASAFHTLMIGTLCIGYFTYNIFVVNPLLVYEFIEKTQHSVAITSRMLLFLPFSFATGPLIGYFRGGMGSYDWIFYIMAMGCAVCAILMFSLPHFARCIDRRTVKRIV